jgi:glycine/serine hydroxymethyltransferase
MGTCEVTRRGMKKKEMLRIAELIRRTLIDGENLGKIKKDVAKLSADFQGIEYCFK